MAVIISKCGLLCNECPAFIAYTDDNDELRVKTAEEWSKAYNADIKPEHINCSSCLSRSDDVFSHPKVCEVRKCGFKMDVDNCAVCGDYGCDTISKFMEAAPVIREGLEKLRGNQ